jgi:hypothetical protein
MRDFGAVASRIAAWTNGSSSRACRASRFFFSSVNDRYSASNVAGNARSARPMSSLTMTRIRFQPYSG